MITHIHISDQLVNNNLQRFSNQDTSKVLWSSFKCAHRTNAWINDSSGLKRALVKQLQDDRIGVTGCELLTHPLTSHEHTSIYRENRRYLRALFVSLSTHQPLIKDLHKKQDRVMLVFVYPKHSLPVHCKCHENAHERNVKWIQNTQNSQIYFKYFQEIDVNLGYQIFHSQIYWQDQKGSRTLKQKWFDFFMITDLRVLIFKCTLLVHSICKIEGLH